MTVRSLLLHYQTFSNQEILKGFEIFVKSIDHLMLHLSDRHPH